MTRRWKTLFTYSLLFAVVLGLAASLYIYIVLQRSLPTLSGEVRLSGLDAQVMVARDEFGVADIQAGNRVDAARALGFLHGQERFFQMDLIRRKGAGELAAVFGKVALPLDRKVRRHRLRSRARAVVDALNARETALLTAYVDGVNAGLQALEGVPFEYRLLFQQPEPWRLEDSILVIYAMYLDLHDENGRYDRDTELLYRALPAEVVEFLLPSESAWDKPLRGQVEAQHVIPGEHVFSLREQTHSDEQVALNMEGVEAWQYGSNGWLIQGEHVAGGDGGMLANDMHLSLGVPHIWYRAAIAFKDDQGNRHRVVGVTLPGTPFVIAGSNGHLAWGFTNLAGDWTDLVEVELSEDGLHYLTPSGEQALQFYQERIQVKGEEDEMLTVAETQWGPLSPQDNILPTHAIRWLAHDVEATNLKLGEMETFQDIRQAVTFAAEIGMPPQNFMIADAQGNIAWTVSGRVFKRDLQKSRRLQHWSDQQAAENSWWTAEHYPQVLNPEHGRLWSGNSKAVLNSGQDIIGDAGMALGARATAIHDLLEAQTQFVADDMLRIQLDVYSPLMQRWDALLQDVIVASGTSLPSSQLQAALTQPQWRALATVDSIRYRFVRAFRIQVARAVFEPLLQDISKQNPDFSMFRFRRWEVPLWQLVEQQPLHFLSSKHESWQALLQDALLKTVEELEEKKDMTWGARNTLTMVHPISHGLPFLSPWLNMKAEPLAGDSYMPRVQGPRFGSVMRMVIMPGREEESLFHMPGGQSGHPLSPYYRSGHDYWAQGRRQALLPGPVRHKLVFTPSL